MYPRLAVANPVSASVVPSLGSAPIALGASAVPALPAPTAPPAPAESVALDVGSVKVAFQAAGPARFLDLSGRFTFEDRAKINLAVTELQAKSGAKVWVLALPGKTDVNTYAAIHGDLKMTQKDLLLIFSADKRHLHSQALPKAVGNEILKDTNAAFYKTSQATGVLAMLDEAGKRLSSAAPATSASTAAPGTAGQPTKPAIPLDGLLAIVAVVAIGWMLLKNRTPPKAARARTPSKKPPEAEG